MTPDRNDVGGDIAFQPRSIKGIIMRPNAITTTLLTSALLQTGISQKLSQVRQKSPSRSAAAGCALSSAVLGMSLLPCIGKKLKGKVALSRVSHTEDTTSAPQRPTIDRRQ